MSLLNIAFLQDAGAGTITLIGLFPALVFTVYVIWDDHRQAKAHAQHGGSHEHH